MRYSRTLCSIPNAYRQALAIVRSGSFGYRLVSFEVTLNEVKGLPSSTLSTAEILRGVYPFTSFRAGSERRQMLREVYPERWQILRFAQNDIKRRALNDYWAKPSSHAFERAVDKG